MTTNSQDGSTQPMNSEQLRAKLLMLIDQHSQDPDYLYGSSLAEGQRLKLATDLEAFIKYNLEELKELFKN